MNLTEWREGVVVRQLEPTPWVNSMVTIVKPNKVRICIDRKDTNQAVQHENLQMNYIKDIAQICLMPQFFLS